MKTKHLPMFLQSKACQELSDCHKTALEPRVLRLGRIAAATSFLCNCLLITSHQILISTDQLAALTC